MSSGRDAGVAIVVALVAGVALALSVLVNCSVLSAALRNIAI